MTRKRTERLPANNNIEQNIQLDGKSQVGKIIQIGSLVLDTSDPRQIRKLFFAGLAATILLGGLIVTTFLLQRQQIIVNAEKPGGPMTGVFNVAVAPFLQENDLGFGLPTNKGVALARGIYEALVPIETELKNKHVDFQVRPPDQIEVSAETEIDLRSAPFDTWADELAHNPGLLADLLIYGYISRDGKSLSLIMYLDGGRLREAEDMTGHYRLGELLTSGGSILDNPAADQEVRDQIGALSGALARFALGLGYYAMTNVGEAQVYFDEAQKQWPDEIGYPEGQTERLKRPAEQALYLFQSKVAGLHGDLPSARNYLDEALALDDGYARAWLGLGQLDYLQSIVDCASGQVDLQGMEQAIRKYEHAAGLSDQPPSAYIRIKADYYTARVYHCISPAEDHWQEAQDKYWSVICQADPESSQRVECQEIPNLGDGDSVLNTLASNAYRDLAILHFVQNPTDTAILERVEEYFDRAIDLTTHPNRLALLYTWLADVHRIKGDCAQARQDLARAGKYYEQYTRQDDRLTDEKFEAFFEDVNDDLQDPC